MKNLIPINQRPGTNFKLKSKSSVEKYLMDDGWGPETLKKILDKEIYIVHKMTNFTILSYPDLVWFRTSTGINIPIKISDIIEIDIKKSKSYNHPLTDLFV